MGGFNGLHCFVVNLSTDNFIDKLSVDKLSNSYTVMARVL